MAITASSWSTQQLTEFLAAITSSPDETTAVSTAIERAAEAFDCEIGALVRHGSVIASVGFPADDVPEFALVEAARGALDELALPSGELAGLIAVDLEEPEPGTIVLGRASAEAFKPWEVILLRGMIRVFGMTLTTIRTVESLHLRQALLETSAAIQHAIMAREPLQEVLDLITRSAGEFLREEVVAIRLVDSDDPTHMGTVASAGVEPEILRKTGRSRVGHGVGGRAIAEDRLVVAESYQTHPHALPEFVQLGMQSAMAAPIHDRGTVIGSLLVASYVPGRTYSDADRETLLAFAQHASLALMDARTVDELLRQALHDPLTSLANRALFLDRLSHALARSERSGSLVAVLFLDLDRFKSVNDSLGHGTGDALLLQVGRRLEALVRTTDTVARFGGDEFAVLVEDVVERSDVERLAVAIVECLREPFVIDGEESFVTASIGIALARRPSDDPLRDADLAMYRAKNRGRNRHEFFEDEMRVAMRERLKLEAALQGAIGGDDFVLHYQPIADLTSGAIVGLEALIRWQQAGRGLVPPADFIPLAEDTGAIFQIGRWALREACRVAAGWHPRNGSATPPYVSVNIAPIQLIQLDLAREIAEILTETRLDPERLVLEITETSLLDDNTAIRKLSALKKLGVRLAVDDFGTGYSSLHYLQKFPLDALKIARPFIDQLGTADGNETLAQAIIDLGRTFELDVIAEGISRSEQLTHLRRLGCNIGQGYLLSAPLDGDGTAALLLDPQRSLPAGIAPPTASIDPAARKLSVARRAS